MIRRTIAAAIFFVASSSIFAAPPAVTRQAEPQIHVRLYSASGVPENVVHGAKRRASDILSKAGVTVRWVDCFSHKGAECDRTAGRTTLIVRIVPTDRRADKTEVMGMAMLPAKRGRFGTYATVYYDFAQQASARDADAAATTLGHVLAHEMGHLLLNRGAHSKRGVMRPHWTALDLRRIHEGGLFFTASQARDLSRQIARRHAGRLRSTSALRPLASALETRGDSASSELKSPGWANFGPSELHDSNHSLSYYFRASGCLPLCANSGRRLP